MEKFASKSILSQTENSKELIIIDNHFIDLTPHVAIKALDKSGIDWKFYIREKILATQKKIVDSARTTVHFLSDLVLRVAKLFQRCFWYLFA